METWWKKLLVRLSNVDDLKALHFYVYQQQNSESSNIKNTSKNTEIEGDISLALLPFLHETNYSYCFEVLKINKMLKKLYQ